MLKLPALSALSIPWINQLFGRGKKLDFHFLNNEYTLFFVPDNRDVQVALSLEFKVGETDTGERFWVRLTSSPSLDIFSEELQNIRLSELPPAIGLIAVNVVLEDTLKTIESILGHPIQLINVHKGEPTYTNPDAHRERIGFRIISKDTHNVWLEGAWIASALIFERFLKLIEGIPLTLFNSFDYIPFTVCFDIGNTLLNQQDFSTLAPNDIILLDDSTSYKSKTLWGRVSGTTYVFKANFDTTKITFMNPVSRDNPSEPKVTTSSKRGAALDPKSDAPSVNADALDVQLTFQVGQTVIKLQELKTLKSGYVFELDTPLAESVDILANGSKIGRGDLVQISDKIGVRVVEFL